MAVSLVELSDEELVALISDSNDFEAFTCLASRYLSFLGGLTRRFRLSLVYSVIDEEDMQQEALLGLYGSALSFDKSRGASFKTYASVCISNRLKNLVRNHKVSDGAFDSSAASDIPDDEPDSHPGPADLLEDKEACAVLLNQIHIILSDFERDVLALYLSGYKRKQISETLHISTKSFDNALQRIRKKLATIR